MTTLTMCYYWEFKVILMYALIYGQLHIHAKILMKFLKLPSVYAMEK